MTPADPPRESPTPVTPPSRRAPIRSSESPAPEPAFPVHDPDLTVRDFPVHDPDLPGRPAPARGLRDAAKGRPATKSPSEPGSGSRPIPRLAGVVWTLLVVNTLGSIGVVTIVRIPRTIIQLVTMGSLVLAFAIALALNHRVRIRPSAYLLLLTLLLVTSVVSSARLESGYGSLFRCFRLMLFVATLWLLTPWWDGSTTFLRYHIRVLTVVLLSAVAGLAISPGTAMPDFYSGRLVDAIWPLTPPQVAHYAAITAGLTLMLWLGRETDRVSGLAIAAPALAVLMLSHTRTATLGLLVGLGVAILSLTLTSARARKVFAWTALGAGLVAVLAGPLVLQWFQRGQDQESLSNLTGRAKVWDALLAAPRTAIENLFGVGLGDKSFGGLPIDSSWLAVFHEQGLVGVTIVAAFLLVLLTVAVLRPPSLSRACAIFLIVYCLTASYTEAGLGDASPYLLNLAMAASLCVGGAPLSRVSGNTHEILRFHRETTT